MSEILGRATERSLVVLDEFGRGTATNDGTALACAVFQHLMKKVRLLCLRQATEIVHVYNAIWLS